MSLVFGPCASCGKGLGACRCFMKLGGYPPPFTLDESKEGTMGLKGCAKCKRGIGGCECKRYVQHRSGHGQKYALVPDAVASDIRWMAHGEKGDIFSLPKSEYRLCDPPKRWRDVTAECVQARPWQGFWHDDPKGSSKHLFNVPVGYQLRIVGIAEAYYGDSKSKHVLILEKEE